MFMNFSGNPSRMLTDLQVIELLAGKKSFQKFKSFSLSHPLLSKLDVISHFRKKEVWAHFIDGTALHLMFYHEMISHGMSLISVKDFQKHASVNEFGMLVPLRKHQFEFLVLQVQFEGSPLQDKFRTLFSGLDELGRRELFQHIQPKYDLVLSVIEELFDPLGQTRYKMMVGLRHERRNSLLALAIRVISHGVFNLFKLFTPRTSAFVPDPGQQKTEARRETTLKKAQGSR